MIDWASNANLTMKLVPKASEKDLDQLANLFQVLSDSTRLRILTMLAGGECNVSSIFRNLRLPQSHVSYHLGLLSAHNVVSSRRNGKKVYYFLNHGSIRTEKPFGFKLNLENVAVKILPLAE
jgi:ArsR family transcriptional regulator